MRYGEPKKAKIGLFVLGSLLVAGMALLFFGWLAEEVLDADTKQFDAFVRTAIHGLASPALTSLMRVVSFLGSVGALATLSLLAIVLFSYFHRYREAVLLAITMAGATVLDLVLKHAFHRTRPVPFFGASPDSYSFPSGHALSSLCFYGALASILSARTSRRDMRLFIWMVAVLLIGSVGFSRIYLGVHYPSDVIAGYCAALVWVGAVDFLDKAFKLWSEEGPERTARTSEPI